MENNVLTQSRAASPVSAFLSRVYLWMASGLAVSALGSWWILSQRELLLSMAKNPVSMIVLVVAQVGLVMWLSIGIRTMATGLATILFFAYSFLTGITFAPILLVYTGASVMTTFAVTAGTFFFFAVYGLTTKRDLTGMGSLLVMALFGMILASLVNLFLKSSGLYWVLTFVGIAVFMGLVAWDSQKLKLMHAQAQTEDDLKRFMIVGALMLYLDFINLFILLLRIFGRQRD